MHFLRHGVQGIDVTHLSDKVIAFSSYCLSCVFFWKVMMRIFFKRQSNCVLITVITRHKFLLEGYEGWCVCVPSAHCGWPCIGRSPLNFFHFLNMLRGLLSRGATKNT